MCAVLQILTRSALILHHTELRKKLPLANCGKVIVRGVFGRKRSRGGWSRLIPQGQLASPHLFCRLIGRSAETFHFALTPESEILLVVFFFFCTVVRRMTQ